MALKEIHLNLAAIKPPEEVTRLIRETDEVIDDFYDGIKNRRNPQYVPSDSKLVYAALASVTRQDLPIGRVFCELGSGFGVGTLLASLLGYEAYGIEIDPQLAERSRRLAAERNIAVTILNTSYLPDGYSSYPGVGGEELVPPDQACGGARFNHQASRYPGMDFDTDEIDVFFVYPWPKEQEMMQDLFKAIASDGAILIAYYGDGEICVYQKVPSHRDRI